MAMTPDVYFYMNHQQKNVPNNFTQGGQDRWVYID